MRNNMFQLSPGEAKSKDLWAMQVGQILWIGVLEEVLAPASG